MTTRQRKPRTALAHRSHKKRSATVGACAPVALATTGAATHEAGIVQRAREEMARGAIEHAWKPWPGEMGVYRCACGASGYRGADGAVWPHKKTWERRDLATARPKADERTMGQDEWGYRGAPGCGRVSRKKGAP